jgi:RNA polymerase sigma factor (sigma-70 family)
MGTCALRSVKGNRACRAAGLAAPGDPHSLRSVTSPAPRDPRLVEELLEKHLDGLKAFLRVRAGAAIRAHMGHSDLVQSVCREVLEGAADFDYQGEAAFRSWLYTAALRKIVEKTRRMTAAKRDVRKLESADATGVVEGAVLQGYATATTPSLIAMGNEGAKKLEEAFDELTEEHREIITMARFVGLSHAEIAAQLGKSEENCRQLLRRALIKLSMALQKRGIEV